LRANTVPLPNELTKRVIRWSVILAGALFIPAGTLVAQVMASANIQATISNDISVFSPSSPDGTQFILQNGNNSCFDVSIDGLQPSLESLNGQQMVRYKLCLEQKQPVSTSITNIRVLVLFNEPVKDGIYHSTEPYSILVNYN